MSNETVRLQGEFQSAKNPSTPSFPNISKTESIQLSHLPEIILQLQELEAFWRKNPLKITPIVSVHYIRIIPKSKRLSTLLAHGSESPNSSIIGAKYMGEGSSCHHVITHTVPLPIFDETIKKLEDSLNLCRTIFPNQQSLKNSDIQTVIDNKQFSKQYHYSKTIFLKTLVDTHYVNFFNLEKPEEHTRERAIVTLFNTGITISDLFNQLQIVISPGALLTDNSVLLSPNQLAILMEKAPFLVCMTVADLSQAIPVISMNAANEKRVIPNPANEPIIGVIDTLFSDNVYFSKWVEYHPMLDKAIIESSSEEDEKHGTAISSIIVDGPSLNPSLDDGCGRFKVRHFGVATASQNSSFLIMKAIRTIISENKDIHVWNLSLGSEREINTNFISPESAILDEIQRTANVIFVVAGTNKPRYDSPESLMGAPADSLNSITVNSVAWDNTPSNYSRKGPVLTFFHKPDICYYGGEPTRGIRVATSKGEAYVCGTSFAAPWIARKLSFLIDVLGQPREVAKALLIDTASGWEKIDNNEYRGYGIVPIRIEDITSCPSDEIRFILFGTVEKYETYSTRLPVPVVKGKFPYLAKATLCYFPKCSRTEGVDYTNTELDMTFGRIGDKGRIKALNNDLKEKTLPNYPYEAESRNIAQKWENTKHIGEFIKKRKKPKDIYTSEPWGISLKKMERLAPADGQGLCFGVVVSLKEINGINRYDDFIKRCNINNWIVQKIILKTYVDIFAKANEEVHLE